MRQCRERMFELLQQLAWGARAGAHGDQLDRQRQPVQPATNRRIQLRGGLICRQPGSRRLRTRDKQAHRIRLGERFEDVLLLGADHQRRAAGDEHRQCGAGGQQLPNQRCSRDDMLEVVEHEQQLFRVQVLTERLADGLVRPRGHAENTRNRFRHPGSIGQCGQLYKIHAIFEIVAQRMRSFEHKPESCRCRRRR